MAEAPLGQGHRCAAGLGEGGVSTVQVAVSLEVADSLVLKVVEIGRRQWWCKLE